MRLPFSNGSFDFAYACFPTRQTRRTKQLIRAALRVLRPGGLLSICVPLHGSFFELPQAMTRHVQTRTSAALTLLSKRPQLMSIDGWQRVLLKNGATSVQAHTRTVKIPITLPLSRDTLISTHLLPTWLGAEIEESSTLWPLIDQAIHQPMEVTVELACMCATRGPQASSVVASH